MAACRAFIKEYKSDKDCIRCRSREELTFHHRDRTTKKFDIGRGKCRSMRQLKEEIAKCDILCDTCHKTVDKVNERRALLLWNRIMTTV